MPKRVETFRKPVVGGPPKTPRARQQDKNFYSSVRWLKLRAAFVSENPLCAECKRKGRVTPARHVHHKQPRKAYPDLAYEWDNLESICLECHNALDER